MDIKSAKARSENMRQILSKNTSPEVFLRKALFARGLRYRLHTGKVPGKPDIFFPKPQVAIFVNGCFWHRHSGCKYAYMPKSNIDFWNNKFSNNINRDNKVRQSISKAGFRQLVVWECTIRQMRRDPYKKEDVLLEIIDFLYHSKANYKEI